MKMKSTSVSTNLSFNDSKDSQETELDRLKKPNFLNINKKQMLREMFQHEKKLQNKTNPSVQINQTDLHTQMLNIAQKDGATNNRFLKAKLLFLMNFQSSDEQNNINAKYLLQNSDDNLSDDDDEDKEKETITFKQIRQQQINKNSRMKTNLRDKFYSK